MLGQKDQSGLCCGAQAVSGKNSALHKRLRSDPRSSKSQIAYEVAQQYFENRTICWVRADSIATFAHDCEVFMKQRSGSRATKTEKATDPMQWVLKWWDDHSRSTLVIFDNADDVDIFREYDEERVRLMDYLPRVCPCVITTKDRRFADDFASSRNSQEVTLLLPSEALQLFHQSLPDGWLDIGNRRELDETERLLEDLGLLPLAIAQAATNIREGFQTASIFTYRSYYLEHTKDALRHPVRALRGVPQSILSTWDVSMRLLEKRNLDSVEALNHLIFFHRSNLISDMLLKSPRFEHFSERQMSEAMSALIHLGFLSAPTRRRGYVSMHTSVQVWGRERLDPDRWPFYLTGNVKYVTRALFFAFFKQEPSFWDWAFTHGMSLVKHCKTLGVRGSLFGSLLTGLGNVLVLSGKFAIGCLLLENGLSMITEAREIPDTTITAIKTGRLGLLQGQNRHAEDATECK